MNYLTTRPTMLLIQTLSCIPTISRTRIPSVSTKCPWLLAIVLLAQWSTGSADPQRFYNVGSENFSNADVAAPCSECHMKNERSDDDGLKMTVSGSIAHDAGTADVQLEGIDQNSFSWFYKAGSLTKSGLVEHSADSSKSVTINVPAAIGRAAQSISVNYCIGQGDNLQVGPSEVKDYNCNVLSVMRSAAPNRTPTLNPDSVEDIVVKSNAPDISVIISADDPDGDSLSFSVAQNLPGVIDIAPETGSNPFSFTIDPLSQGNRTVNLSVSDGKGGSDSLTFKVIVENPDLVIINPGSCELTNTCVVIPACEITNTCNLLPCVITNTCFAIINFPPMITSEKIEDFSLLFSESRTVVVEADDDNSGDTLTYASSVSGSSVTVTGGGADGTFDVAATAVGTSTVMLSVTDKKSPPIETSFDVTVLDNNSAPVSVTDSHRLGSEGGSAVIDVLDNDYDPDGDEDELVIVLLSGLSSRGGTVTAENGLVTYTPPAMLDEEDMFQYRARDLGLLESDATTVTVFPSDVDGDGVYDVVDNCKSIGNSDQQNMDGDALGDKCDPDPDGDGEPGISGQELPSGRALVEKECLVCHNSPSSGAPQFNDKVAWDARLSKGVDTLVGSVVNGVGGMQAFGNKGYSIEELTAAVLYISGVGGEEEGLQDRDLDGIADGKDNCPNLPNNNQADADENGVGDICEPRADNDADGYPVLLDNDDSNASRLPGQVTSAGSSGGLFLSENQLRLGRLAEISARATDFTAAGILMGNTEFLTAANVIRPEITHLIDPVNRSNSRIVNVRISGLSSGVGDLRIGLSSNLLLSPKLRVYDLDSGIWSDFATSPGDILSSTASGQSDCPASNSSNYSDGLQPGVNCLRLLINDGGPNDADGTFNGEIEFLAGIGSESNGPAPVIINPSKSGGGRVGLLWCLTLMILIFGRWVNRKTPILT